jgi:hypothetical protein
MPGVSVDGAEDHTARLMSGTPRDRIGCLTIVNLAWTYGCRLKSPRGNALREVPVMTACPTCGSTRLDCLDCGGGFDQDAQIAAWLVAISAPPGDSGTSHDFACTACGYSGDPTIESSGTRCPACGILLVRPSDVRQRVARRIECPGCGRMIGVTDQDVGKTVICPGCKYFLGTPLIMPRRGQRRPRGRARD